MEKILFMIIISMLMVNSTWAGCPVSNKKTAISDFVVAAAEKVGKEEVKVLLKDCTDDEVEFGLDEFRKVTLGIRLEAVDQYANGKLNVLIGGLEAADNLNRIVIGDVCLGLIEAEALKRNLVGLEDLYKR